MVPVASEFKRVPGLKKILEDGIEVILRKQMENHAEVVVYKNGYVSYHAHERYTVFAPHVLDTQILHIPGFNLSHHCQKSGTVKAGAANAIVREMDNVCKALPCGELLQHCLLIGYGIALTLLVIIFAKVITAQSFVQSCDFLIFSHNLRSFLRF